MSGGALECHMGCPVGSMSIIVGMCTHISMLEMEYVYIRVDNRNYVLYV